MVSSAKKPKKSAEEAAIEARQRSLLDDEILKNEQKFKALSRGKLGFKSLLTQSNVKATASKGAGLIGNSASGGTPNKMNFGGR